MKHIQFSISVDQKYQEPLIAELEEMGFEGYQQLDEKLVAYIAQKDLQIGDRERIEHLLAVYPGNNFIETEEQVDQKNWNRTWEQTVEALSIGQFLVKPTWSNEPVAADQILLEIDPKMSFGTGYHATTRLMLKMLTQVEVADQTVLDAGTGTGILAIAAAKLGASSITAFDIDEWSIKNIRENMLLNQVDNRINVSQGSIDVVPREQRFDLILANINKNTILAFCDRFEHQLSSQGTLLLAGFLEKDLPALKTRLKKMGLSLVQTKKEGEWFALLAIQGE